MRQSVVTKFQETKLREKEKEKKTTLEIFFAFYFSLYI